MADFPRKCELPAGGEEQLHSSHRGPVCEGQSNVMAPEDRTEAGAGWLPDPCR